MGATKQPIALHGDEVASPRIPFRNPAMTCWQQLQCLTSNAPKQKRRNPLRLNIFKSEIEHPKFEMSL